MASRALQVLREARELISVSERWTQGLFATDPDGNAVYSIDPSACRWCALGAVIKTRACLGASPVDEERALEALEKSAPGHLSLDGFNDSHEHAQVLALFDRTIARLEQVAGE